jgi:ankyrin repeat protein
MINRLRLFASSSAIILALSAGHAGAAVLPKASATNQLVEALRSDDHAALKGALAKGADVNTVLPETITPIYLAVDHQDAEAVHMLLSAGAKAEVKDQDGNTPLLLACQLGNPDIVNALLDAKADPLATGEGGDWGSQAPLGGRIG